MSVHPIQPLYPERTPAHARFWSGRKIFALLVLLLLLGGMWVGVQKLKATLSPPAGAAGSAAKGGKGMPPGFTVPAEVAVAQGTTLDETVSSVGSLVAEQGVMLRPEVAGVIAALLFKDGDRVKAGQPLIQMEDSVYRAQVAQAEAALALARRMETRASTLAKRGAGTVQMADQAAAQLASAQAAVQLARATLAKTLLVAPFDGVVGIRQVNPGDYLHPGQDLVTLQSLDAMKVDFRLPETLLAQVGTGQRVSLVVGAYPDRTFTGEVSAIDPLVDPATRSIAVRARIPNPDGLLRPGLFATLTLVTGQKPDAVFIPSGALAPMGGQQFVFKVADGMATLTPVTLGVREAGRVQILSGVSAGETVVTAGQVKLMMMGGAQAPMGVKVVDKLPPDASGQEAKEADEPTNTTPQDDAQKDSTP